MTAAIPLHEAARTLGALITEMRKTNSETVLTENGEPVAKLVVIPASSSRRDHGHADFLKEMNEWHASTDDGEREAFARDIERGREVVDQTMRDPWE